MGDSNSKVCTIMIVENGALLRSVLGLLWPECKVLLTTNGEEALQLLAPTIQLDLVICNYHLPGGNGLETLKRIREMSPKTKSILIGMMPIQILTRLAQEPYVDACLSHSFTADELLQCVDRILHPPSQSINQFP